ncbi:MAG: saccharopine dehydrogenase [candidate division Zixibacteria bacterium]|nr:saccharopine dehydrogenase [candidate division Zixibacteria bacterium]
MKIIVLGAGLVGAPMAVDLAKDSEFTVSVADLSSRALTKIDKQHPIETIQRDLSKPKNVKALVDGFDIVVNAVPGFMGFQTLKSIIEAGKDVIDIAFFPEDPFQLDELAKEKGVTAVVDCGVAPGMSNILIGHVDSLLDKTEEILIYVGGLPEIREWPYEYKAPFSSIDVIEEYIRPARYVENGQLVVRPALSEPELIDFPDVGTLEVFNTDGLRSLARTINAPNMKEKTMRYPGHIEKMRVLRETGFFSQDEIDINGTRIRPIDLTSKLLFPKWEYSQGEADITVMQVTVEGVRSGQRLRYKYDLLDRYDAVTETLSMARTTGYTATMAVRLLANGMYSRKGLSAPEQIGRHQECVEFLLNGLRDRGVVYKETIDEIS